MQNRKQRLYSFQVEQNLDNIISKGIEINRKNILDAESIQYKKVPNELFSYDEFGFLDKYKTPNEIKE
jgi:hypothetical protein